MADYPINKPYILHGGRTVSGIKNTAAATIEAGIGVTAAGAVAADSTTCVGPTLTGSAVGEGLPVCPAGSIVPWKSGGAWDAEDPLKVTTAGVLVVATLPTDVALVKAIAIEASGAADEYPLVLVK